MSIGTVVIPGTGLPPLGYAPFAAGLVSMKRSAVFTWNNADIVAGSAKTIVPAVPGKILIPFYLLSHYDGHANDANYASSRAFFVRWAGMAFDLITLTNTVLPNTRIEQYSLVPQAANAVASSGIAAALVPNPSGLALSCGPTAATAYLGVTPVTVLTAQLLYMEMAAF